MEVLRAAPPPPTPTPDAEMVRLGRAIQPQQIRVSALLRRHSQHVRDVVCVLSRNKNDNVVCFQAKRNVEGKPIGVKTYWLMDRASDPVEGLTFIERQSHAFDLDIVGPHNNGESLEVSFAKLPKVRLWIHAPDTKTTPSLRMSRSGRVVTIARMHAHEKISVFGVPSVTSVTVIGWVAGAGGERRPCVFSVTGDNS